MKLSQILFKQHLGRQTRRHWYVQGKRTPMDTNAEQAVVSRGIEVVDAMEVVTPKREKIDFKQFMFLSSLPIPLDENHPDWHDRPCLHYKNNNLLVEGLPQAQQITKTIVFENTLPEAVKAQDIQQEYHKLVKRIIESSVLFDAHQEKLPKKKDPERYYFNFPRLYGISDIRRASNLSKKLIQLCECISGPQIANTRSIIDDALLYFSFEKEFELYKLMLTMDIMILADKPLMPAGQVIEDHDSMTLPSLQPMHHSIGLIKENIYKLENFYPLVSGYHKKNVHTIFVYFDPTTVKNTTELEVKESQVFGHSLMKAFTAAASSARQKFGLDVKELPEPITVQCIQTDGKRFYFSVYQLNTLDIDGEKGVKNYSWVLPKLDLYKTGDYVEGRPVVKGYNPEVFQRILAFYKNN